MKDTYSKPQLFFLMLLRVFVGWHLLYEGIAKLLNPQWSSDSFLNESQWILSGFSRWIVSDSNLLGIADFLNTWGLIFIGTGLILGFLYRTAAISGAALLFIYYVSCPPFIGFEYSLPADGNNLIVNKTLIEAVSLCILALFPVNHVLGIDMIIPELNNKKKESTND
jgi:thiosulfate dehydrogenase (quinone) large subunit